MIGNKFFLLIWQNYAIMKKSTWHCRFIQGRYFLKMKKCCEKTKTQINNDASKKEMENRCISILLFLLYLLFVGK